MPPIVATFAFAGLIAALFWLDRDPKAKTSGYLWVPLIWFGIACSRPATYWYHAWFQGGTYAPIDPSVQVMEGSPIDRFVFSCLLAAGVAILLTRGARVQRLLQANGAILMFVAYCAVSLSWSDFPDIAFKRLLKACGDIIMVLIVLSDRDPVAAFKKFLARLSFFLIPVSILFIKYYPALGMGYNYWTGAAIFTGVTTYKNTLGVICLCFGLGAWWRLIGAYQNREAGWKRRMIPNGIVLLMVLRLFQLMDSKTSQGSFLLAAGLILLAHTRLAIRRPMIVHVAVASMLAIIAGVLFLGVSPDVLVALGRNPTLTERTLLWEHLLTQVGNPMFGTGFESFWLGPRLEEIWRLDPWRPNEAHNGYLEVFLNLGWVGILLLVVVVAASYKNVVRAWRQNIGLGSLGLGYFFAGLTFNCTEAAMFKMQAAAWLFFLLAIVKIPKSAAYPTNQQQPPSRIKHRDTPAWNTEKSPVDQEVLSRG